ncbi:hypothetical protein H7347_05175 [Corynebacterium sp. zg-331]|uniref:imm68 putative immunity domain-containing protein n=1 Tax=unclassified Corynebacterium TaxID=2624378 RepID=UPI0016428A3C|nr:MULTISPECIES: imm68 putative immunity domain-containing protein [unclassified Corynebacterium]MBC3185969.1 hypothetical protein [Corynebacterium sp. zg-331]
MCVSLQETEEMAAVVAWLESQEAAPVELSLAFAELGLEDLHGNYTDAALPHGDAFLLAAGLAAVVARAKKNAGAVELQQWGGRGTRELRSDVPRIVQLATAMKYFALDPEEHRVARRFDEDALAGLADQAETLRGQLD